MRTDEAPQPGWYPDPEGGFGLRWWECTDWADHRRAVPTPGEASEAQADDSQAAQAVTKSLSAAERHAGTDAADIVSQARDAARDEIDRTARRLSRDLHTMIGDVHPTIIGYITPILRWLRIGIVVAALLVIAWFAIQFIAQATFFEWLGDRVDNITNDSGALLVPL